MRIVFITPTCKNTPSVAVGYIEQLLCILCQTKRKVGI